MRISFVILLLCLLAGSAFGVVDNWYVSTSGDDTNDGKSWGNAFRTFALVADSIDAGDTVRVNGDHDSVQIIPPTGGTYSLRTVYLDSLYEATGTVGGATISSAEYAPGSWTNSAANIWWIEWTPSVTGVQDANSYKAVNQNDSAIVPRTSKANMIRAGMSYYDQTNDTMWVWLWGDANPNSQTMTLSARPTVYFSDSLIDHVLFQGLKFRMGTVGTVCWNEAADSIFFEHCNIYGQSGGWPDNPGVINGISWDDPPVQFWAQYNTFVACSVSQCYPATGTPPGWVNLSEHHRGAGVLTYGQRYMLIDSCVFFDLPGVMVTFKNKGNTYDDDSDTSANVVRFSEFIGNPVADSGSGGGVTFLCGGWMDSAYGNTFRNMNRAAIHYYIVCDAAGGIFVGNNSFYNCNPDIQYDQQTANHRSADVTSKVYYNFGSLRWLNSPNEEVNFKIGIGSVAEGDSLAAIMSKFEADSNAWHDTSYNFGYAASKTWAEWKGLGFDVNGDSTGTGFNDPANGNFTLVDPTPTMNVFYAGQWWRVKGAVQPVAATRIYAPGVKR